MNPRISLLKVSLVSAAVLTLSSCTGDSTAFPLQPFTCRLTPPAAEIVAPALSDADMKTALDDIATRIVPTFAAGDARAAFSERVTKLSASLATASPVAECLALESSRAALDAIPATPETAADRALVVLLFDVVAATVQHRLEAH